MTPEQIRLICLRMAAAFHTPNSMSANCLDILEYAKAFEKFILGPQPVP